MAYYVTEPSDGESSSNHNVVAEIDPNFFSLSNKLNRADTSSSRGQFQLAPSPQIQNTDIGHIMAHAPMQETNTNVGFGVGFKGIGGNISVGRNTREVDPNALDAMKEMYKARVEGCDRATHEIEKVFIIYKLSRISQATRRFSKFI